MESHQPHGIEIEIAGLVLRYAHTRIVKPKALTMMTGSLERFGQINPVLVVVEDRLFVLIDGYLRVLSLTRLGRDTVMAYVCEQGELKALFQLLAKAGERQWEAIEQARILHDIKDRFGCSASEMARSMGRDVSWVSRRLALLEALSDDVLAAVCQGHVSTWAATRVLVPLARAKPSHAEKLTQYLSHSHLPARDLAAFLKHYESSNRQTRERMIGDPSLFFKAHKSTDENRLARALDQGPEGEWIKDCSIVTGVLRRLLKRVDTVIYPGQDELDRTRLLRVFRDAQSVMARIDEKICEAGGQ
ncbi:MAG: chromosome partitioning protein ParB [Deltaproteobacteria bacterium]|nr:chromosome partitioning protein ParB [Deltaproteobacteria bacterium]